MSQEIIKNKNLTQKKLDSVFNPSDYRVVYHEEVKNGDLLDEKKKKHENDLYNEVVRGLGADMERLGMEATCSSSILIGEVAMNILLLHRAKYQIVCKGVLREKQELKKSDVFYKKEDSYPCNKKSKSIHYEKYYLGEEIHPIFDKLLPKLQKQINKGLKELGLLPLQSMERQKLVIIKKLKKQLKDVDKTEYSVEARKEIRNLN